MIYQDLEALKRGGAARRTRSSSGSRRRASTAHYITGDVTTEYLAEVERGRDDKRQEAPDEPDGEQADLRITA